MTDSTRPSRVVVRGGRVDVPIIDAAVTEVRPARLAKQLRRAAFDPTYSDPVLEKIVASAADRARTEAQAAGYAAGWAQGRQAAAAEAASVVAATAQRDEQQRAADSRRVAAILAQLAEAARAVRPGQVIELAEVATALADAAIELAAAVLDRELRASDDAVRLGVQTALARIADPEAAVVHLNPQDATLITDLPDGVRLVPDPAVPLGEVVVLTPAQRLRLDLPAALAAAREVLSR
jgi:flagellar assembly protein FliH